MKYLYIFLGIIALLLIIAAFLPKTFELQAETVINKPKQLVRDYGKLFANQKNYSVRVMADPNVKLTYAGTDGTVGARQSRDSTDKNVGKGEQEITKIDQGKSIEVEIRFERPMQATNYARGTYEDLGNGTTKVSQVFWGKNPRPMNLMSMFFLPKVEKDMQQNMDNLKAVLEK
jgi:hypothetical protein